MIALFLPAVAGAEDSRPEQVPVSISVNSESKGDFLVYLLEGEDVAIRPADLAKIGFKEPASDVGRAIDEQVYLSLKGMRGVAFKLSAGTASLKIAAAPRLLVARVIDLGGRGRPAPARSAEGSFFFNYGVEYRDSDAANRVWSATGEVGARSGNLLLVSNSTYRDDGGEDQYVRLMSRAMYDDRQRLQRLTLGDLGGASGVLGGSFLMGGIGFEKKAVLDPDFVRNPSFGFSGITALPAELEISVDGVPVHTEKLTPGAYDVSNFWARYGGHRQVDVTIRDVFGNETRLGKDFYFSDFLLKRGYQEYGYYAGFLREDYGVESNEYGDPAVSAYHRIGVNDVFTAGLAAEASGGVVNGGPLLAFPLAGVAEVAAAGRLSSNDGEGSGAADLALSSRWKYFGWFVHGGVRGRDFAEIGNPRSDTDKRYSLEAGANFSLLRTGSVTLGYTAARDFDDEDQQSVRAGFSGRLTKSLSLNTALRQSWGEKSEFELAVDLIWRRDRDVVSARLLDRDGEVSATLDASRLQPEGLGFGYRAHLQESEDRDSLRLGGQYNGPYGEYRAEVEGVDASGGKEESVALSTAGSLTVAGGNVSPGRPVRDAFALVRVGDLAGVRVYRNNQVIGRTGADGTVLLPNLNSFYENQVRIDERDIPMDYSVSSLTRSVSPAYRQGMTVPFDIVRFQAISGFAQLLNGKGPKPLEYGMLRLTLDGKEIKSPTGKAGEFYFENIPTGTHEAIYTRNGTIARCTIVVPASAATTVDLGTVTCVEVDGSTTSRRQ